MMSAVRGMACGLVAAILIGNRSWWEGMLLAMCLIVVTGAMISEIKRVD